MAALRAETKTLLETPDATLKNGAATAIKAFHLSAGIPSAYYWIPEARANSADAVPGTDLKFKRMWCLYMHQLLPVMANNDVRRAAALALTAGRMAITAQYGLAEADIIPTQVSAVAGVWSSGAVDATFSDAVTAQAAHWVDPGEILTGGTMIIETFIQKAALTSIGMPVCQGVVLYKTGSHHFVDPHKAIARAVIKQAFPEVNGGVAPMDKEQMEDLLAHKMAHPIDSGLMVSYAVDADMPARLKAANLASAAVRLPAKSDGEAFLAACIRLVVAVTPALVTANTAIGAVAEELTAKAAAIRHTMLTDGGNRLTTEAELRDWVSLRAADLAFMAGVYMELTESVTDDTLTAAKSIRRLIQDNPAAVNRGREQYKAGRAWENTSKHLSLDS